MPLGRGAEVRPERPLDRGFGLSWHGECLSDTPGDPGSQLPYQEFPSYYLAPIRLVFSRLANWHNLLIL